MLRALLGWIHHASQIFLSPFGPRVLLVITTTYESVGKTSLLNRFSTGKFTGQYKATIGADFLTKDTIVTDLYGQRHWVTLQLWDTAGQERFQSLGVGFYRGADGAILCYDITDAASLDHLEHWQTEFLNQVGGSGSGYYDHNGTATSGAAPPFPFVVLGNKIDKERDRRVPLPVAEAWCQQGGRGGGGGGSSSFYYGMSQAIPHLQTSAKTAVNVDEAFNEVARLALNYEAHKRQSTPQLFVPPSSEPIDLRRQESGYYADRRDDGCC